MLCADPEPGQHGHGQHTLRQASGHFGGQVVEIHLSCRKSVVSGNRPSLVEQHFRHRQVLLLVLNGLVGQPGVHIGVAASKLLAWMLPVELFEPEPIGKRTPLTIHPA